MSWFKKYHKYHFHLDIGLATNCQCLSYDLLVRIDIKDFTGPFTLKFWDLSTSLSIVIKSEKANNDSTIVVITEPQYNPLQWLVFLLIIFRPSMVSMIFTIGYAIALILLGISSYRMMRKTATASPIRVKTKDRTGLRTIHPELLDENGNITEEKLFIIRFPDKV